MRGKESCAGRGGGARFLKGLGASMRRDVGALEILTGVFDLPTDLSCSALPSVLPRPTIGRTAFSDPSPKRRSPLDLTVVDFCVAKVEICTFEVSTCSTPTSTLDIKP